MPNFAAVSRERHQAFRWLRPKNLTRFSRDTTALLAAAELPKVIPYAPVAFIAAGASFELVAVLSLFPGKNMFVGPDGRWLASYTPAIIRSYPFRLLVPEGATEPILCIDEECGLLPRDANEGEPFFDSHGGVSSVLKEFLSIQANFLRARAVTQLAVAGLQQAGLIVPWPIKIQTNGGEQNVEGLYRIDETALNAAPIGTIEKLRALGALPIAYGQLFSMNQLSIFRTLADLQVKLAPQPVPALPDTLDELFDIGNDAELHFR